MRNQWLSVLTLVAVGVLVAVSAASAAPAQKSPGDEKHQQLILLAKILSPLRELSKRAGQLEGLLSDAVQDDSELASELHKRQQQWEAMDYGWGGGRFGKRAGPGAAQEAPKRYDMYGNYGRFGRDTDHVDPDGQQ